ncbi:MAG: hypothetical protein Q4A60_09535 [Pasteurellaceae bacterium]|nr:hypothetical protein [Pasteurellaceae bacterium]
MKQQTKMIKTKLSSHLQHFVNAQEGVYSVMMGVVGVTLMVVVAFAVDGSGAILDQARLSDSLEQASLTLTAENNTHRTDDYELKGRSDRITQQLKTERNKQIVEGYVRSYLPQSKSWEPHTITCDKEKTSLTSESVRCRVSGTVVRDAWLPFIFNTASENNNGGVIRVSNTAVAEKQKASPPLDIMLVADFSGSMRCLLDRPSECRETLTHGRKIDILKSVLIRLTDNVLFKEKDSLTRIGLTTFSFGSPHNEMIGRCALPYQFRDRHRVRNLKSVVENIEGKEAQDRRNLVLTNFVPNIDVARTIDQIAHFDGSTSHYGLIFDQIRNKSMICVGYNKRAGKYLAATKYWFDKESTNEFKQFLSRLEMEGATLSSAGMLVGANQMVDVRQRRSPAKVGSNTQRVMIILSDGKDELAPDYIHSRLPRRILQLEMQYRNLMPNMIQSGLCRAIRRKFDSLNDAHYPQQPSKLVFIAFGYDPNDANATAWRQCVGANNFFVAKQEAELLEAFKKAVIAEEIGHSVTP